MSAAAEMAEHEAALAEIKRRQNEMSDAAYAENSDCFRCDGPAQRANVWSTLVGRRFACDGCHALELAATRR